MRKIELTCKEGCEAAFGAALEKWSDAEPLLKHVSIFARAVSATLDNLEYGDGPNIGQLVDDRPRAVTVLRQHVPAELVESGTVEGRDWLQ